MALKVHPDAPHETQVKEVERLISKPEKWQVRFAEEASGAAMRIYMGEPLVATVECLTTTGAVAELQGTDDIVVDVHVLVNSSTEGKHRISLGHLHQSAGGRVPSWNSRSTHRLKERLWFSKGGSLKNAIE